MDPPRDAIVALYENLWGRPSGCEAPLSVNVPIPDGEVGLLLRSEVQKRNDRFRPGGAPGPDGVSKPLLNL